MLYYSIYFTFLKDPFEDYPLSPCSSAPGTSFDAGCKIPWMRPQENFYYYDSEQNKCTNFPYTGACGGNNNKNGFVNAFPSYTECIGSCQANSGILIDEVQDYDEQYSPGG